MIGLPFCMYVVVYYRLRIRANRKGTVLILSRVIVLPSAKVVAVSCFWLHYTVTVTRVFQQLLRSSFVSRSVDRVDIRCLVISYYVFVISW